MSRDILVNLIDPDPEQPRRQFEPAAIQELADSLTATGQIVPITVRPAGERFIIVQGERRWRAAQLAGIPSLRAEVVELDPVEAFWQALTENIQRADLSPIEEAQAYQRLVDAGHTQTAIAKRIGKTPSYIAQKLRLLKMAAEVQDAVQVGKLTEGHARQLLRLEPDRHDWGQFIDRLIGEKWTVRRLRNFVDYTLMVWYAKWWSVDETYGDLKQFVERMPEEVKQGYADRKMEQTARYSMQYHNDLLNSFRQAGYGALAEWMGDEVGLGKLTGIGKTHSNYIQWHIKAPDAVKATIVAMLDVDDLVWPEGWGAWADPNLPEDTTAGGDGWRTFWHREVDRRLAWFEQVQGLPAEQMQTHAYTTGGAAS